MQIKSDLKKLKALLIFFTFIYASYLGVIFSEIPRFLAFDDYYNVKWIFFGIHLIVISIFIWYIWKKYPAEKKSKLNSIFLILFLGIIGLWLWMPNQKEINQLLKE